MTIITQGVTSPPTLVARQEIRTFAQDKELMELYLLGLERFQKSDQNDPLSWYQVAGIHGRPYVVYDGATGSTNLGGNFGGYCTHSSTLFPPWHRPYLALFEQILAKHVTDIANEYQGNDRQKYLTAAQKFRIPYWDWAANADLPDFISIQSEVVVNSPTGSRRMPNPLYSYRFHPMDPTFGDGTRNERAWESWMSTIRWPTRNDGQGVSDSTTLESVMQRNRAVIRLRVYNLLTQSNTYAAFSNDGFLGPETDPRYYDSLESIHGAIHGLTGNSGHMGNPDFAAFDPVFWLHHANVDRYFALWQALHPTLYVTPRASEEGTFTTRPGTREGPQSNLTPFWRAPGQFWTSEGARDTRTFNYTYPELAQWSTLPPDQKAARLRTDINNIYGRGAPFDMIRQEFFQRPTGASVASVSAKMGAPAQQPVIAPDAASASAKVVASVASATPRQQPVESGGKSAEFTEIAAAGKSASTDGVHYTEWIANITVEKFAAKRAFMVHIFLGDFTTDSAKWGQDPNLVGTHIVFANNIDSTGCERCHDNAEGHKLVTGTIPLTSALADRLGADKISKLEPAEIIPYLQRNLHWRIQLYDGTSIERTDMPSLKVAVAHFSASVPESISQFPTWGDSHKDTSVTVGRPGGAGEDD